jgi:hypothetical protein
MDFSTNRAQPQPAAQTHTAASSRRANNSNDGKWGRIGVIAAVAAVVVLLLGLIVFAAAGNSGAGSKEDELVKTDKLQAVFLNTGQVYFGNIKTLNNKYLEVSNIYYLQTSSNGQSGSTAQSNTNVSLVKLGCELHEPFDRMVINRDSVTFWENLQDGGQVAAAVKKFEQQNPNGQKCSDQSNASSTNSGNSAQPAGTTNTGANNAAKP